MIRKKLSWFILWPAREKTTLETDAQLSSALFLNNYLFSVALPGFKDKIDAYTRTILSAAAIEATQFASRRRRFTLMESTSLLLLLLLRRDRNYIHKVKLFK